MPKWYLPGQIVLHASGIQSCTYKSSSQHVIKDVDFQLN